MENELQILSNIEKNEYATQRDLAKSTGMSLGNVNLLIKRLVKKGLVKIERLNAKTIRYILTPQGMKEKAEATYKYVVASYKFINDINFKVDEIICEHSLNENSNVILFGENDEVCALIKSKCSYMKIQYSEVCSLNELIKLSNKNLKIIVWHPKFSELLTQKNIKYIDVLDRI